MHPKIEDVYIPNRQLMDDFRDACISIKLNDDNIIKIIRASARMALLNIFASFHRNTAHEDHHTLSEGEKERVIQRIMHQVPIQGGQNLRLQFAARIMHDFEACLEYSPICLYYNDNDGVIFSKINSRMTATRFDPDSTSNKSVPVLTSVAIPLLTHG